MATAPSSKPDRPSRSENPAQAESPAQPASKKRKFPLTTLLVVVGVVVLEVGTVLVVMWLSKGPSHASADPVVKPDSTGQVSEDVEELIVESKAANTKRGTTYVYKLKVHAVVAQKDLPAVRATMDRRRATIEDTVRQVIARLEPKDLDEEPELATFRRVLMHEFEPVFGPGKIKELLVPEWTRYKVE